MYSMRSGFNQCSSAVLGGKLLLCLLVEIFVDLSLVPEGSSSEMACPG